MEFLKSNIRITVAILFTLFIVNTIKAQDNKLLIQAFSESYALDKKTEHKKAVEVLKAVYEENSYELNIRLGWLCYQSGLHTESIGYYNKACLLYTSPSPRD